MTARAKILTAPKRLEARWEIGDVVQVGSTRWAVRILDGNKVELEALNVSPGIWWTTTVDVLPDPIEQAVR